MRNKAIFFTIIGLLLFALPVLSAEVIRFKSGTVLVVNQHRIEKNMIYVTLGNGNELAFPLSFVDKIESKDVVSRSGDTVFNRASSAAGSGGISVPETDKEGWSSEYNSIAKFTGGAKRDHGEQAGYAVNAAAGAPSNPALSKVKVSMNPAFRRNPSKPQDMSEMGSTKPTISISSRSVPGGNKSQVIELKPKSPQEQD